jgi:chromosome segregation ATPase
MGLIRRLFGIIAVLVGLVGFLLCIVALGFTWFANARVKDGAQRAVEPAEKSIVYVQKQLEKGDHWIVAMRNRLDSMKSQVDQLASLDQVTLRKRLDQFQLDHEAVEYDLQRAELLVNVSRESIGTLTELSELVENVPMISLDEYSSTGPLATGIKQATQQLADFTAILLKIRETLEKVRAEGQQLSPQTLKELSAHIEQAETQLSETHDTIIQFRLSLRRTADDIAKIKEKLPSWIDTGSWILTAILVWLGISQYTLIAYGQALLRST